MAKIPKMAPASSGGGGNGGIMGSGIFGMFGTIIQCDAESTSTYCTIMKAFNVLMVVCIVLYMLYFAYNFAKGKM
jgi:hypothetical protein